MKTRLRSIAAGLLLAGIVSLPAQAAEVFNNGSTPWAGNNPFSNGNIFVAEDFSFASATTVRSLSFNAFTTGATVPITAVNVKFYSDSFGAPGTEFFSASLGTAGSSVTGTYDSYTLQDFFVNTGDVSFAAGTTYWMGLQVDPAQWDMHWTLNSVGTFGGYAMRGDGTGTPGAYSSSGYHHAFGLYDTSYGSTAPVPEPETYAMMLAGLGLLAFVARRRRHLSVA